jgi:hypothetical protein
VSDQDRKTISDNVDAVLADMTPMFASDPASARAATAACNLLKQFLQDVNRIADMKATVSAIADYTSHMK